MTSDDDRIAYLGGDDAGEQLDDAERRELDDMRALLADPSLWAEPSDSLEGAVIAAIADQAHAGAATAPPVTKRARSTRARGAQWLVGAAAAAAVIVVVVGVLVAVRGGSPEPPLAARLTPTELAPGAQGEATFRRTDGGWRIELDATGLPRLDDGRFYEAWLRNDAGVLVSIGTFNEPDDIVLWAGVSPHDFPTISVTREAADGDPTSSGERVLGGPITER
jgi:hypothetical protein